MTSDAAQQRDYRARLAAGLVASGPGRPPKPIAHGERRGAAQHRRRGERPCDECLAAERADRARLRRE